MYYRLLHFQKSYTSVGGEFKTVETSHEYRFEDPYELSGFIREMAVHTEDDLKITISKEDADD